MSRRLVFMGSDPIALPVLDALASRGEGPEVVAVYTQPDRARGRGQKIRANPIKEWALDRGIPVCQPARLGEGERVAFAGLGADLVLVLAYGHILDQTWLDMPPAGFFNLHTSLLPRFRGASPIQATLLEGGSQGGVTLMRLVARMDAGPIVDRERVDLTPLETAATLEAKLAQACVPLVLRNIEAMERGEAVLEPQDESAVTYTRRLRKTDGRLDFAAPAPVLARRVNGLHPWPGVVIEFQGTPIRCGLADAQAGTSLPAPGTVLEPDASGLRVATGEGILRLRRLQRPGGRMLDAVDFLRGFPIDPGVVLPSRSMPVLIADQPLRG
jgi:methionyl-tRNA formyltransferase